MDCNGCEHYHECATGEVISRRCTHPRERGDDGGGRALVFGYRPSWCPIASVEDETDAMADAMRRIGEWRR